MTVVAFDFTHALINHTGVGRYPKELLPRLRALDGLEVVPLAAPGAGRSRTTPQRLMEIARRDFAYYPSGLGRRAGRHGAQIIHCPAPGPAFVSGTPLVMTVHDLLWIRLPQFFTLPTKAYHRLSLPAVRRAARVLTNSHYTRGEVIELLGLPEERVVVTPFGVDPRFAPRDVDRAALRERFDITGRYVLAVATREPRKNQGALLRAFERLAPRVDDVALVLVGGRGWRSAELERTIAAVGDRVRVTGFVSDDELVELYAGATCFAFPSFAEGFGLPVLEAMASGVPVVTSDRTALPEVAGDAALLVNPDDDRELEDAIEQVLTTPELAADLTRRGLARSAGFTWQACALATRAAYPSPEWSP